MLKFLRDCLICIWIIDGIKNLRSHLRNPADGNLAEKMEELEKEIASISQDRNSLARAANFISIMWRAEYEKYIERHKTSIAKAIHDHHANHTLNRENKKLILQDIITEINKSDSSPSSETLDYMNKGLIHFFLYHTKENLSSLLNLDSKKITFIREEQK